MTMLEQVPGWEGSSGPFPGQYGKSHVYARDVHSGAGNCVCGRALLFEAWSRTATPEERADLGDVDFADVVGSRESRCVTAVDVAGHRYGVMRLRGEKPLADVNEHSGAVVESLAVLVAAVAGLDLPALTGTPYGWQWEETHG